MYVINVAILVTYVGSERHQVTLPSEVLLGREVTLNDLLEVVVNTTGITRDCVKMIYKGW